MSLTVNCDDDDDNDSYNDTSTYTLMAGVDCRILNLDLMDVDPCIFILVLMADVNPRIVQVLDRYT